VSPGKSKKDVFITNMVHCHPPDDRKSKRIEIYNCAKFLDRELAMVRPRLIVALGNDARDALKPKCRAVAQRPFNGAELPASGPVLLHLTHPAHMLQWRNRSECDAWAADLGAAVRWAFG
jgi:DNA polymerase